VSITKRMHPTDPEAVRKLASTCPNTLSGLLEVAEMSTERSRDLTQLHRWSFVRYFTSSDPPRRVGCAPWHATRRLVGQVGQVGWSVAPPTASYCALFIKRVDQRRLWAPNVSQSPWLPRLPWRRDSSQEIATVICRLLQTSRYTGTPQYFVMVSVKTLWSPIFCFPYLFRFWCRVLD